MAAELQIMTRSRPGDDGGAAVASKSSPLSTSAVTRPSRRPEPAASRVTEAARTGWSPTVCDTGGSRRMPSTASTP
jgi:hypothetical protein